MRKAAAVTLFVCLLWYAAPAWSGNLELHFLDVHQGDSTLVVCPNGNRILVDAGDSPRIPGGKLTPSQIEALRNYLAGNFSAPNRLEHLVVTHGDSDHFRLLDDLLADVKVGTIIYGGHDEDYTDNFKTWILNKSRDSLLNPVGSDPTDKPNGNFDCGTADVWILASNTPHRKERWKKNTRSLVLKITYGNSTPF